MSRDELRDIAYEAYNYIKEVCPRDTGNMCNRIVLEKVNELEWRIEIGGEPAPYAVYTNEPWISPRWNGKKNPNERWIDKAVEHIVQLISSRLGGEIKSD